MKQEEAFRKAVQEGLEDVKALRLVPHEEVVKYFKKRFKELSQGGRIKRGECYGTDCLE